MILTTRFAAVVLAASVLVAIVVRSFPALLAIDLALALLALLDVLLAGSLRSLQLSRTGATTTRLGEQVEVALVIHNDGRRVVAGVADLKARRILRHRPGTCG